MSNNQINVTVTPTKNFKVNVSAPNPTGDITVSPDTSAYNADIAKQWAISESKVLQQDYSSKYYANKAQNSADIAKNYADTAGNAYLAVQEVTNSVMNDIESVRVEAIESVTEIKDQAVSDVTTLVNDCVTNVETIKNNAIQEVNTAQNNSLQAIKDKGEDIIADIEENGKSLPMFTPIWTDHIYNDASYLRADTFSWHNADIYVTGYEIIEREYNNENCTIETENGVTYKLSPNGFKIADASQNDTILNLYESGEDAWFYIIDTVNRKFKLPREKSNEYKYLYFYVGNYSRPDTEINLGILAELANSQDLESVLASINEVKDTGIAELEATTASGVASVTTQTNAGVNEINAIANASKQDIETLANTGVSNVTSATNTGVQTVNTTATDAKNAIQAIVDAGIPTATLETAGIVRPDGETITIVDGVISSAGGTGDAIVITEAYVNGANGYNVYSNGYCEQWGTATSSISAATTITLSKPFKNTSYNIVASVYGTAFTTSSGMIAAATGKYGYVLFGSLTTASCTAIVADGSGTGTATGKDKLTFSWRACGYIS